MIPEFIQSFVSQYYALLIRFWNRLTPEQYLSLLISIAVIGWLLMRSGMKR